MNNSYFNGSAFVALLEIGAQIGLTLATTSIVKISIGKNRDPRDLMT